MARRTIPEHFKQNGNAKRSFQDKASAWSFAAKHKLDVTVYKCGFCGSWHLASRK